MSSKVFLLLFARLLMCSLFVWDGVSCAIQGARRDITGAPLARYSALTV